MNLITQWIATPNKLYDRLASLHHWTNRLTYQDWQRVFISTPRPGNGQVEGNTRRVIHEMIIDNQQPCVKKKSITFSIIGKKLVLLQFETKTLWTHPSYH